jgi:hypothetical protein
LIVGCAAKGLLKTHAKKHISVSNHAQYAQAFVPEKIIPLCAKSDLFQQLCHDLLINRIVFHQQYLQDITIDPCPKTTKQPEKPYSIHLDHK